MAKTVLITGSSRGIGRETAIAFANKGWNVIATMRNPDDGKALEVHENLIVLPMDVEHEDSVDNAVISALAAFEGIDVVVNNAGFGVFGALEAIPSESIARQFSVNLFGMMRVCRKMLPHFRERRAGMFIQLSSMAGKVPFPLGSVYNASKFAVEGFCEGLIFELQAIGASLKIIEPGVIDTDALGSSLEVHHDVSLSEYQRTHSALITAFEASGAAAAPATLVAECICEAATDGKDQLRYIVGNDARFILDHRKQASDSEFFSLLESIYKL